MNYLVYKITNLVNGKIYIGVHQTENINDSYMGSGTVLRRAQAKYGIVNFSKEILHNFDSADEMFSKELEIVNENFVSRSDTYNVKLGGDGGWDYVRNSPNFKEICAKGVSESNLRRIDDVVTYAETNGKISDTMKMHYANGTRIAPVDFGKKFLGKTHSAESKSKISRAAKLNSKGSGNSQFGTMWVTDGESNKKISKTDDIPNGWRSGRVMKIK